jgi:GNAT superfamily N-acetyltransferase
MKIHNTLEELTLNAWPALQNTYYDGWLLRFADGYTRRANSVNPIYPSHTDPGVKIAQCEQVYAQRGQRTVFKITPAAQPIHLDSVLDAHGYAKEALTSVQVIEDLAAVEPPAPAEVTIETELHDVWLSAFCRLNRVDERRVSTMTRMLNNIIPARCFVTLRVDGEVAAVALGVAERGYVGAYDVVTAEHLRGKGYSTQLMLNLLAWARAQGASHAYLQVMLNNPAALRLYEKLGYREVYQYWYRVK